MSPPVTSVNWLDTCINSRTYQLSSSSKLLPLPTKWHSIHILCIDNKKNFILTILIFFSPLWQHLMFHLFSYATICAFLTFTSPIIQVDSFIYISWIPALLLHFGYYWNKQVSSIGLLLIQNVLSIKSTYCHVFLWWWCFINAICRQTSQLLLLKQMMSPILWILSFSWGYPFPQMNRITSKLRRQAYTVHFKLQQNLFLNITLKHQLGFGCKSPTCWDILWWQVWVVWCEYVEHWAKLLKI